MTLGGIILILLVAAVVFICYKVREHSSKIKKLEETSGAKK